MAKPSVEMSEPAFPRGGRRLIGAVEKKRLREEAIAEAKQDLAVGAARKRSKNDAALLDDEDLAYARGARHGRPPKFAEVLRFRSLAVGSKIWGCVASVSARELALSLPDGLRGLVPAEEASDVLSELLKKKKDVRQSAAPALQALFRVGQFVRASVVQLEEASADTQGGPRKRIILSLKVAHQTAGLTTGSFAAGMLVPGCVSSVEDHGCVVTFGVQGAAAFLDAAVLEKAHIRPIPGALIDVTLSDASDTRMMKATLDSGVGVTKEAADLSIGSLLPGMLVHARIQHVLSDGLLVSFLTYFNGSIDPFHVVKEGVVGEAWKTGFKQGQRVKARIIFVDPASKKICLSLLPHLVKMHAPALPEIGSLVKDAVVQRVDSTLGVLLDLGPLGGGYAHISDVSEERVEKLDRVLRPGQRETARVIGARAMDGLAVLSLKPSAVEQYIVEGATPGAVVSGEVVLVDDKGVLVNIARGVNAYVPTEHASDLGDARGKDRRRVGSRVTGRVLHIDAVRRRMTMTLKRVLVDSKLKPLLTWQDAEAGVRAHGIVHGVTEYGVFVRFYNDVKGLLHVSDLALEHGSKPADVYAVGQVVKVKVVTCDTAAPRLTLSLASKKKAASAAEAARIAPGTSFEAVVRGVVDGPEGEPPTGYRLDLLEDGRIVAAGDIDAAHLSDHPVAVEALLDCVQVGTHLGTVVVLGVARSGTALLVTRKHSLVSNAAGLPASFEALEAGQLHYGFVQNATPTAVFVSFLGGLTGRAALAKLADAFVPNPESVFSKGQSVRALVLSTDPEKRQFSLSLAQSSLGNTSGELTAALFRDLEAAAAIRAVAEEAAGEPPVDWSKFGLGAVVGGSVHELRDIGTLVDLDDDPDVVGLVSTHQVSGKPAAGDVLRVRILDVNKRDGILDLTLKPRLVERRSEASGHEQRVKGQPRGRLKTTGKPEVSNLVSATIQLHRTGYAVASLPAFAHALAYIGLDDFNAPGAALEDALPIGSSHRLTVAAKPATETGGRMILRIPDVIKYSRSSRALDAKLSFRAGTVVKCCITKTSRLNLLVDILETGLQGRIHVSEVTDEPAPLKSPLTAYKAGAEVTAVVVGRRIAPGKQGRLSLSLRASALAAAEAAAGQTPPRLNAGNLRIGSVHQGYITNWHAHAIIVALTSELHGVVSLLDAGSDPAELTAAANHVGGRFQTGQPVQCRVLKAGRRHRMPRFSLVTEPPAGWLDSTSAPKAQTGALLTGRILRAKGSGVHLQLGDYVWGRACLGDLHDTWVHNALRGLAKDMYVRCCVLQAKQPPRPSDQAPKQAPEDEEEDASPPAGGKRKRTPAKRDTRKDRRLLVSLKASLGGVKPGLPEPTAGEVAEAYSQADLKPGKQVCGYVQHVGARVVFVALGRDLVAIAKKPFAAAAGSSPAGRLRPGQLVGGEILPSTSDKIEMRLSLPKAALLAGLHEGQAVRGVVERADRAGLLIRLSYTGLLGLIPAAEAPVNLLVPGTVGTKVRAVVRSIDIERKRLTLGLGGLGSPGEAAGVDRATNADGIEGGSEDEDWESERSLSEDDPDAGVELEEAFVEPPGWDPARSGGSSEASFEAEASADASDGEGPAANGAAASRHAPILSGAVGWGDEEAEATPSATDAEEPPESIAPTKKQRKRQKHENAAAAAAAIEAAAAGSTPREPSATASAADFERAVAETPDSSAAWTRYMAFELSLGEIARARRVAERALETINFRLEDDKLRVWVARLELEVAHGEPPDEAAAQAFQRALPFNDQKKLYLAFIDILSRAGQDKLLQQTFKAAIRKFSQSAKVWLRQVAHAQCSGDAEAVQRTLERAVLSAPQRKHIKILRQAALQDFKLGSQERGRSTFEKLLRNYPKRTDLWSVYLDQEVKQGDVARVRSLFQRATALVLPAKKMKFLFKRFLDYEVQHGTAEDVEAVKAAARDYVQQHFAVD